MAKILDAASRSLMAKGPVNAAMDPLYRVEPAASLLNIAPKTLRNWISAQKVTTIRFGNRVRIPLSELNRLIEEGTRERRA
jgi:excisionase family DNA binding protein